MLRTVGILFLLVLPATLSGITVEVVKLFQPLSLHGTDGVGDEPEEGNEPLQAAVLSRPMAISGAVPEDLVKAVALPHKIGSNSPAYDLEDANLLNLCKVSLTAEMKGERLLVRIDVANLAIPEAIDLTSRHIVQLTIVAIRKTLKDYFKHGEETMEVSVGVIGTKDGNAALKELSTRFKAGE